MAIEYDEETDDFVLLLENLNTCMPSPLSEHYLDWID